MLEVPLRKKTRTDLGHPAAQIVLVDTPGIHKPTSQLDRRMMQEVQDALESRDLVLFLVDVTHRLPRENDEDSKSPSSTRRRLSAAEDEFALSFVRKLTCPVILLLNKIDMVRKDELLPLIAHWSSLHHFAAVIPISAKKKQGLELLLDQIITQLPEGQRYFPKYQLTDQPERFLAAEIIREKILLLTGEEVPYATAVVIEKYEEPASLRKTKDGKLPVTKIAATIFCERAGQKAILIGKNGEMLKRIGTNARKEIESLLGTRVFLELFIKVHEDWRSSASFVEDLDWRRQLEEIASRQTEE